MSIESDIKGIRTEVQGIREDYAVAQSKRNEALSGLATYGIKTVKQAEKAELEVEKVIEDLKKKSDILIEKVQAKLNKFREESDE